MSEEIELTVLSGRCDCADAEDALDSYIDGELPYSIRRRLERHLRSCEQCRALFEETREVVDLASKLGDRPLPPGVGDRLRRCIEREAGLEVDDEGSETVVEQFPG